MHGIWRFYGVRMNGGIRGFLDFWLELDASRYQEDYGLWMIRP
jgi:hypothetical protein